MIARLSGKGPRPVRFAIAGLTTRDELVLKSMVRLLQSRAPQPWEYHGDKADVLFMGAHNPAQDLAMQYALKDSRLVYVGIQTHSDLSSGLTLPLNPHHVEHLLKSLGAAFDGENDQSAHQPLGAATTATSSSSPSGFATLAEGSVVSLSRWPSLGVLGGQRARSRMATLLMGKRMRIAYLARLSGEPLEVVMEFMVAAQKAGFLQLHVGAELVAGLKPKAEAPAPPVASAGLLSAIRQRLGLHLFGRRG